jgi:hypothetical protein
MQICKIFSYLILEIAVTDKNILNVLHKCAKLAICVWSIGRTFGRQRIERRTAGFT